MKKKRGKKNFNLITIIVIIVLIITLSIIFLASYFKSVNKASSDKGELPSAGIFTQSSDNEIDKCSFLSNDIIKQVYKLKARARAIVDIQHPTYGNFSSINLDTDTNPSERDVTLISADTNSASFEVIWCDPTCRWERDSIIKGNSKVINQVNISLRDSYSANDSSRITLKEGESTYAGNYLILGDDEGVYRLFRVGIHNTPYNSDDGVSFTDFFSEESYSARIVSEGEARLTVDGRVFDIRYYTNSENKSYITWDNSDNEIATFYNCPYCGDGSCGSLENCSSCSTDCGNCQISCIENWQCSSWSNCSNNQQTRTCTDYNNCGTVLNKPLLIQSCSGGSSSTIGNVSLSSNSDSEDGTETTMDSLSNDNKTEIICDGCILDDKCMSVGYRNQKKYCDMDNELKVQNKKSSQCQNNYECESNLCTNNECSSNSLWDKIIRWFSNLFSRK